MLRVPVRHLAEFVHRRGDLHARLDGRTRPEEGIAAQRKQQRDRPDSHLRERPVSLVTELAGRQVTLSGRVDGCDLSGTRILVEEFKCTRADPERAHGHHASAHWAQARLYAGLLGHELSDRRDVELRLVYCHPDHSEARVFARTESAEEIRGFLHQTLAEYEHWLVGQRCHETGRDERLRGLAFPYPSFRPFQRAMARRAYRALRDREHLLLEAPTGSGKTAATLFPALRSLEGCGYRRVLFLTSRTTGALAAHEAVGRMDPQREFLRYATITARDKMCFVPGTPCEPDACPYARGYYDRARGAVAALLERRAADPDTIAAVAQEHRVCPFELSLDAAIWCDLVVADYNYVFDPLVRLQRFAGDADAALLVDEAHQIAPRVRDMLSLSVSRREVADALAESVPEPIARRLRSLDRALTSIRRRESLAEEKVVERPDALLRSMQRLVEEAAISERPLDDLPATRELLFACSRWLRAESWYDPERFLFLGSSVGRTVLVRLVCVDPGPYIRARLDEYGGHVRFSGTVSPLALYAGLHGEPEAPSERAGNPFTADQVRVLVVDDVPTYLRRRHDSVQALADLVDAVTGARDGHYLVAFPSFEYLRLAADAWQAHPRGERRRSRLLCQTPAMSEHERAAFLSHFQPGAPATLGFVVLGGVFGESVDFSSARLTGVICVGVGLPPPSLTRDALARYFSANGFDGPAVAFHQPAMVKVLQMAGRLLRSPDDRGVLCLVDARFRDSAYRQFFPDHWQPATVCADQVPAELARFWGRTV